MKFCASLMIRSFQLNKTVRDFYGAHLLQAQSIAKKNPKISFDENKERRGLSIIKIQEEITLASVEELSV